MNVDAHHHFWDPELRSYYWMKGPEMAPIVRRFEPHDMRPLIEAAGIDKTVIVQTVPDLDETREFLDIAATTDFVAGVIGWVDLTAPDVGLVLAELRARPDGSYLKGIRHQVHDEADPRWLLRDDVQRGLAAVADAGLVYDLLCRTAELAACVETVALNPEMRFVLDHIAKPAMTEVDNATWYAQISELACYPNVSCKLSGMVTEAGTDWTPARIRPFAEHVLTEFGDLRVLFGSDWPVSLLVSDYAGVVALARDLVSGLTDAGQARVFGTNAVEIYRL